MKIEELNDLIETATEQLTADYACYFGKRDAEIIIELANKEIEHKKRQEEASHYLGKNGVR